MLKQIINEKAISIPKMAKIIGITPSTIYRHVEGKSMSLSTAKKYAEFLGVSVDELTREGNK